MDGLTKKHSDATIACVIHDSRSGSTLLSSRLNELEGVCVSAETSFLFYVPEIPDELLRKPSRVIEHLVRREKRFSDFIGRGGMSIDQLVLRLSSISNATWEDYLYQFMSSHFGPEARQFAIWILKCGMAERKLAIITKMFPGLKFIHIYRDGRAVLNSRLRTKRVYSSGFMANDVIKTSLRWRSVIRNTSSFLSRNPERITEIAYEDLVADISGSLERMGRFLSSGKEIKVRKGVSTYLKKIPEAERSLHINIGVEPNANFAQKFMKELDCGDRYLFEIICWPELKRKKYGLSTTYRYLLLFRPKLWRSFLASVAAIVRRKVLKRAPQAYGNYGRG